MRRRLCSRPACSGPATAVFGFDPDEGVVWLGPLDAPKRVGDLCERHARAMAPPHGWTLQDRRPAPAPEAAGTEPPGKQPPGGPAAPSGRERAPAKRRAPRERHDVPLPFDEVAADPGAAAARDDAAEVPAAPVEHDPPVAPWTPRFDPDDDLGGLLDAKTPLLSRAFGKDVSD